MSHTQEHKPRGNLQEGFTLMEIVIVMAMLVVVLVTAYNIFLNCIETERKVEELSVPEKVGEGILTLMRRDLAGAVFKGCTETLDNQVFVGLDNPGQDGDADSLYFVTTVDPTPREEDVADWENIRALTMIGYRLEANQNSAYTLYRKEIVEFGRQDITNAPGLNYNVYDKVKSLNIEFFDGYEWFTDWDSVAAIEEQQRLQQQQQDDLRGGTNSNIPTVNNPAEGDEELLGEVQQQAAPIPTAVRITLEIYSGTGNKLNERNDQPVVRKFTTLVPLLASKRLALPIDDEALAGEGGAGGGRAGDGGQDGAVNTFGADLTKKGRGERGKGSLRDKLAERPGRGAGRGQGRGGRNPAPGIRDKALNALKNNQPSGGRTNTFGSGKRGGGGG